MSDICKRELLKSVFHNFALPTGLGDAEKKKVFQWTLKKMAEQFMNYKKRLYHQFIKIKKNPNFEDVQYRRIRDQWQEFKDYKESEEAMEKSAKNKLNADKKQYFQRLGPGGYKTAIPKWQERDAKLIAAGVTPSTSSYPARARHWAYSVGLEPDPQTGNLVLKEKVKPGPEGEPEREKIRNKAKELDDAVVAAREGRFAPNREKDELSLALGNPEHTGRVRGVGVVPWKVGFPEHRDTYRSRDRKKKQEAEKYQRLEDMIIDLRHEMRQKKASEPQEDQLDMASQRKSSVASTQNVQPDDATYPVDQIQGRTNCELHIKMRNLSIKVAVGFALENIPGATLHGGQIPAGYARVGVDEIMNGFEDLELDFPGAEGETTLGEVLRGIILWRKEHIVFPGESTRRPPTPPSSNQPPSPPRIENMDTEREPSATPSPRCASPTQRESTPERAKSPLQRESTPELAKSPPTGNRTFSMRQKMLAGASSGAPKDTYKYGPSLKDLPVLTYHRTVEENAPLVKAHNAAHFAKKVPEPKQVLNPKGVKHFLDIVCDPDRRTLPDNYERSISKSFDTQEENKKKRVAAQKKKKAKQVPQLGEQKVQSVAPLKVQTDKSPNVGTNVPVTDYMDDDAFDALFPKSTEIARKFVYGKDLLPADEMVRLAYQMRRLHEWYMKVAKDKLLVFYVTYRADQFLINNDICVKIKELWQLFNRRALNATIMSCYVL